MSSLLIPGIGLQNALIVLTVANAMGLICTVIFVPESKGMSLEDFEGEVRLVIITADFELIAFFADQERRLTRLSYISTAV